MHAAALVSKYACMCDPIECKLAGIKNQRDYRLADRLVVPFAQNLIALINRNESEYGPIEHKLSEDLVLYMCFVMESYCEALHMSRLLNAEQRSELGVCLSSLKKREFADSEEALSAHWALLRRAEADATLDVPFLLPEEYENIACDVWRGQTAEYAEMDLLSEIAGYIDRNLYRRIYDHYAPIGATIIGNFEQIVAGWLEYLSHMGAVACLAHRIEYLPRSKKQRHHLLDKYGDNLRAANRHLRRTALDMLKIVQATIFQNERIAPLAETNSESLPIRGFLIMRHRHSCMGTGNRKLVNYFALSHHLCSLLFGALEPLPPLTCQEVERLRKAGLMEYDRLPNC